MITLQNNIILLIVLLGLSAFFSGSETALTYIDSHKVKFLREKKKFGSKYLNRLNDDPQRMLITILIGNNIVNITASVLTTSIAYQMNMENAISFSIGIMTLLILVFGEIFPKSMATKFNAPISLVVATPIWWLSTLLYPIIWLWKSAEKLFSDGEKEPFITEDELKTIVNMGHKEGTIKEAELIHKIFKFDDIMVKDIMTPLPDTIMLSADKTIKDFIKLSVKSNFSRLPVYEYSKDKIVGVVYIKDVLKKIDKYETPLKDIMDNAYFVPETKKTDELLKQFQKRKRNLAMVVNEHGAVIGIVTLEDVLEEIVGEIMDETEKIQPEIKKLNRNTWQVLGKADIETVNEKVGLKFKEEKDFTTIGGFVLDKLGRIPEVGEEIEIEGATIFVLKLDNQRIDILKIIKNKK